MHWSYCSLTQTYCDKSLQSDNSLAQDCGNSIADAPEPLRSCTEPLIWQTIMSVALVQDCGNSIINALELPQSFTNLSI